MIFGTLEEELLIFCAEILDARGVLKNVGRVLLVVNTELGKLGLLKYDVELIFNNRGTPVARFSNGTSQGHDQCRLGRKKKLSVCWRKKN